MQSVTVSFSVTVQNEAYFSSYSHTSTEQHTYWANNVHQQQHIDHQQQLGANASEQPSQNAFFCDEVLFQEFLHSTGQYPQNLSYGAVHQQHHQHQQNISSSSSSSSSSSPAQILDLDTGCFVPPTGAGPQNRSPSVTVISPAGHNIQQSSAGISQPTCWQPCQVQPRSPSVIILSETCSQPEQPQKSPSVLQVLSCKKQAFKYSPISPASTPPPASSSSSSSSISGIWPLSSTPVSDRHTCTPAVTSGIASSSSSVPLSACRQLLFEDDDGYDSSFRSDNVTLPPLPPLIPITPRKLQRLRQRQRKQNRVQPY